MGSDNLFGHRNIDTDYPVVLAPIDVPRPVNLPPGILLDSPNLIHACLEHGVRILFPMIFFPPEKSLRLFFLPNHPIVRSQIRQHREWPQVIAGLQDGGHPGSRSGFRVQALIGRLFHQRYFPPRPK
jgi:hypothetical protein